MYSEIDVHTETHHDSLEGWLIHNTDEPMELVESGDGTVTWRNKTGSGEWVKIDAINGSTSRVTIQQHDGRVFETTITTKEI